MKHHIKDTKLASQGKKRIEWVEREMPVLGIIKKRFEKEKPLQGITLAACLHVTSETANLARTLKAGGALVFLCASNPLSTQDDVAASLVKHYEIPVFAKRGENTQAYYKHINYVLDRKPQITMDDGADLISELHSKRKKQAKDIFGSMEETTTGLIRLKALEKAGKLRLPIIAVNEALTKYLFDNRYGTGQSTLDGIIRATDILIAGKSVVVAGYGWCGKGFAMRAKGLGARVIITEVNAIKALEAVMDGFQVMPMKRAASVGDIFCTLTGDIDVINKEHFAVMKDGSIVCNSGHFDVEINITQLERMAKRVRGNVRQEVDEYTLNDGRRIYLLSQGRLINLSAAKGHPASVMDMSFSTQALSAEFVASKRDSLENKIYKVPQEIEDTVSRLKLKSMNVAIDTLTKKQMKYLSSWNMGT